MDGVERAEMKGHLLYFFLLDPMIPDERDECETGEKKIYLN